MGRKGRPGLISCVGVVCRVFTSRVPFYPRVPSGVILSMGIITLKDLAPQKPRIVETYDNMTLPQVLRRLLEHPEVVHAAVEALPLDSLTPSLLHFGLCKVRTSKRRPPQA